jgi:hypothetical protein
MVQNLLISQGCIFRILQHFATKPFAILLILGCSFELYAYNDRFRLSCLDNKLVDSWNHP